jgi:hypothetical protein
MTEAEIFADNNKEEFEKASKIMNEIIFDGMEWEIGDLNERIFLAMTKYANEALDYVANEFKE